MVKSAPFGSKGSNPLQDHAGVCMYPCVFHVLRALATAEKNAASCSRGAGARVLARGSVHGRATPTPLASRAALRLWLFLGCNRISGQTQNDIASPCTAILRLACHRVWLYQEF